MYSLQGPASLIKKCSPFQKSRSTENARLSFQDHMLKPLVKKIRTICIVGAILVFDNSVSIELRKSLDVYI